MDTKHGYNPSAIRDAVLARNPINAGGLTSTSTPSTYTLMLQGLPVLRWEAGEWVVDGWAAERHSLLNFLSMALHYGGQRVLVGTQAHLRAQPE